jgi:hypothetical protein
MILMIAPQRRVGSRRTSILLGEGLSRALSVFGLVSITHMGSISGVALNDNLLGSSFIECVTKA